MEEQSPSSGPAASSALEGAGESPNNYGTIEDGEGAQLTTNVIGLRQLGTDTPLALLAMLLFAMPLCTFGLRGELLVSAIALSFGILLSFIFIALSHGRPMRWEIYNYFCLLSTLGGSALGWHLRTLRVEYHSHDLPVIVVLIAAHFTLAWTMLKFMAHFGYQLFGSSVQFKKRYGWGWNQRAANQIRFGIDRSGEDGFELFIDKANVYPTWVAEGLLASRCYWSGEPQMDYVYSVLNDHSFLGPIFCHPAHPYDRRERIAVLVILSLLIVFPVAVFTQLITNELVRQCVIVIVVTFPRNVLKQIMLVTVLVEDREILDALEHHQSHLEHAGAIAAAHAEKIFFATTIFFTLVVVTISCIYLHSQQALTSDMMVYACVGMVYFFVLEFVAHALLPRIVKRKLVLGFFGRWWTERFRFTDK